MTELRRMGHEGRMKRSGAGRAYRCSALLGAAFLWVAVLPACGPSEGEIREEIKAARACSVSTDCVVVGSYCPFGCSITVRADERGRIQKLLADYASDCEYECAALSAISCTDGLCSAEF